ncbi:MAG TPA: class II aldolase/adducin family protein [Desulfatirhabdiaceae bacterium]|nr:class II aldolase/adducin family protein [Desulfatirhabdiaceae bacterium]
MTPPEGVIQFNLSFQKTGALDKKWIQRIQPWRHILFKLNLIGQSAEKYDGYGYGNISERLRQRGRDNASRSFVISGSQTGHLSDLTVNHYALVTDWCLKDNVIISSGPLKPSSESLTHAAVYEAEASVNAVIHIHSAELWHRTKKLGIPATHPHARCGTSEMAQEVLHMLNDVSYHSLGIFSLGGHEDGMIGFGSDVMEAGLKLIRFLALP